MDTNLFLQRLRDLPLEEGHAYIQEHIEELSDHNAIAKLLEDEALRVLYSPFLSLKIAELLIFYGDYTGHLPSHALGLKAKGDALMMIGHHQAAMECSDAAGKEFLKLGDEGNWGRSRISWIYSAAELGRVDEALIEAKRARELFVQLGEIYWALAIDHNIGLIYVFLGRYQEAIELYENMRSIYPTLTNQDEQAIIQRISLAEMNQACNMAWLGDFEQSYRLQQQALTSFLSRGETDLIVNAMINLADIDYTQGYYGSALRRYYQARDILTQDGLDASILLAVLKLYIANCLVKLNRTQDACILTREAVELYRRFNIPSGLGRALYEHATTLAASGKLSDALTTLDEASTILGQGKFNLYALATVVQRAELLLAKGDVIEAYREAAHIKELLDARGMVAFSVRATLVMIAALIEKSQRTSLHLANELQEILLQEALMLCRQVILKSRQYNLQEESYKGHYFMGKVYALKDNQTKAARHYGVAIIGVERILSDLVYDLSPTFLQNAWAVFEDMIALCLQQAQPERAFNYLEQARSLALRQYLNKSKVSASVGLNDMVPLSLLQRNHAAILRTQYDLRSAQEQYRYYSVLLTGVDASTISTVDRAVIVEELKRYEEKISSLSELLYLYESNVATMSYKRERATKASQIDITQIRQVISSEQVLLAYFLYKGRLVIFAITSEGLIAHELADGMEQLEQLLPLLHAHMNPKGWPDPKNPPEQVIRRLLSKLYDLLVKPISELLSPTVRQLTIVPYGPLHKLPFHALYDGTRYLVESFRINYLPASNILPHLKARGREGNVSATNTKTVIKSPLVFGYSEGGYLQRVYDEAETVTSLLNGRCFLDGDATIERLIEQASGSSIIHVATHGQSRPDAPNFSYVRLADGQLNAIDAFSLDLKECELVTLSGCETGLALSGGGDEQLGLGRAFLAAGATSLVISLWSVEDNATNKLMRLFYQHLLAGENKAQALQAAQCRLLHDPSERYKHPYFWAAFRLVGNTGPLRFQWNRTATLTTEVLKIPSLSVSTDSKSV